MTWLRDASAGDPIGNLPLSTAQYSSARAEGIDKLTNQHTREEHDEGLISAVRVILVGLCMDAMNRAQNILSRRGGDHCDRARLFCALAAARPIAHVARCRLDAVSGGR